MQISSRMVRREKIKDMVLFMHVIRNIKPNLLQTQEFSHHRPQWMHLITPIYVRMNAFVKNILTPHPK